MRPLPWLRHSIFILVALMAVSAYGQRVNLLTDLTPEPHPFASSNPSNFADLDSISVFQTTRTGGGLELWRTDGTEVGTYQLKVLGFQHLSRIISPLATYEGNVYFLLYESLERTVYLWKTDGTVAGTRQVDKLFNDVNSFFIPEFKAHDNRLYFRFFERDNGYELYYYDLTTGLGVHHIRPGSGSSNPFSFVTAGEDFYCMASPKSGNIQDHIVRLKPDGSGFTSFTISTPAKVQRIHWFTANEQYLYVCGSTTNFNEFYIWKLDAQTGVVVNYYRMTQPFSSVPILLTHDNGRPFYMARMTSNFELRMSNTAGDGYVKIVNKANNRPLVMFSNWTTRWKNHIYLTSNDGTTGGEMFRINPATGQAELVVDLIPNDAIRTSALGPFAVHEDQMYFIGADFAGDRELYVTDGTASGTRMVKNIRENFTSNPAALRVVNNTLVFVADDGIHGRELWTSDGTEDGTTILKDINASSNYTNPSLFTQVGNRLVFKTQPNNRTSGLYVTDGSARGTTPLLKFDSTDFTTFVNRIHPYKDKALVTASDGKIGEELYLTNGLEIELVKDINLGQGPSSPNWFTEVNSEVYFTTFSEIIPHTQVYKTGGTEASTELFHSYWRKTPRSTIVGLTSTNDLIFGIVTTPETGYELLVLDPYKVKPAKIIDICPGGCNSMDFRSLKLFAHKNLVYFANVQEQGLWRSDGTEAGTYMLAKDHLTNSRIPVEVLDTLHGEVYFLKHNTHNQLELWKTDGTKEGTMWIETLGTNANTMVGSFPTATTKDFLYFYLERNNRQIIELMRTDGTRVGTRLVKRISDDRIWRNLSISSLNDTTYFMNFTQEHGAELWKVGPDLSSVQMVADIFEGSESSNPTHITTVGNRVYFAATNPKVGNEVYYLEDPNYTPPVTEEKKEVNLVAYPNPTTNRVVVRWKTVEGQETTLVELFDLMGKKVHSLTAEKSYVALDLEGYAAGVYVVRVRGIGSKTLIKK